MDSIGSVLRRIVSLIINATTNGSGSSNNNNATTTFWLTIDQIKGNEKLTNDDREKLDTILKNLYEKNDEKGNDDRLKAQRPNEISSSSSSSSSDGSSSDSCSADECEKAPKPKQKQKKKNYNNKNEQPKVGTKSGTKGKVVWKFGGHKCYGTLLPSKETKTHCYARTHKGNIKTLAKGKDYWSVLPL